LFHAQLVDFGPLGYDFLHWIAEGMNHSGALIRHDTNWLDFN